MSSLLDKVDALAGWTAATPGACNGGRAMATDDPDLLGWPVILLVVMAIVSAMMAIAYPNVTSGLEGVRLKTTVDRAGQFWIEARQHADPRPVLGPPGH